MIIRTITITDAFNFLELCKMLDKESTYMMLEPGERNTTIEDQTEYIKNVLEEDLSVIFVCEINGKLVGYVTAIRENFARMRHSAYIVTGILEEFTGQGIGTRLFEELEKWAFSKNIHRLELTVMRHNLAGLALYMRMGFEIEGTKKHSLMINNQYVDEYYMAKLMDSE
jgi:RimJ/RimL family protein N-acetyltransferase